MKKLFISGLILFIVCFLLGCLTWFGFEQQNNKLNSVNKTFDSKKINSLKLDSQNSSINIKRGKQFAVKYSGKKRLNIDDSNQELSIQENSNSEDHYGLNFNPFRRVNDQMTIIVPDKQLDKLTLSCETNATTINNVDIKSAKILFNDTGGARITVKNSTINDMFYRGTNSPIHLTKSDIKHANIKSKNESIIVNDSLIESSVLLANKGNIELNKMDVKSDFKASTQHGNIHMRYNKEPNNTLLKLNPENGNAHVNNKMFIDGKVGDGQNVLEFYTNHGDIHID
ncbi:DUF4097 family beta strand repeat-containing protein [Staphylococcus gallinarum]|uniref:DUF4097 domain-containing protein n=1 Tax=Staphylococcus gallinarum TaxID=1293 RepID=A0ABQ0Y633_STAGA|nr:DUF4097 family beta strand repeat-containing protein [Staphylococcus gallinarum]KIR11099.1 hypothetical protein SH09_09330 [Staphylococcus gallinarum]MCD8900914.1 DUF4097 domain-containing protein [Staphylococcus gallinarum]MCD8903622.1 DUF4097 domain-containing protein [Staphylococcus gallinarum]MCD8921319.1 DUF4097 domain-containing protein [Staphylococcus gallinarum]MEB6278897.1 DUF4097 domain-containing protein [Staphylococcus gallinarum]